MRNNPGCLDRLRRAHERAHEPAVDLGKRLVVIGEAGLRQEASRVGAPVDARRFDVDRFEPGPGQLAAIALFLERARDAPDPQLHAAAQLRRDITASDHHIRDRKPAAGLEHTERFREDAVLVGGEIDDAVRDDHVHRVVRQWNLFDLALEELDVRHAGLLLILAGEREHLVGHVEPVGLAGSADAPRREEYVDAAARTEVEDDLAGVEVGERRGIPASERGEHGLVRYGRRLTRVVQIRCNRVAALGAAPALRLPAGTDHRRRSAVLLLNRFLQCFHCCLHIYACANI
jgi:hypothetical protein